MQSSNTEARERVLMAAEKRFAEKGYNAVTLREIAQDVGIRHASLYHHVPGGKEELFVEVTERNLERHRRGLTKAIEDAPPTIRAQLRAVAHWLLSQPPMDLVRMTHADMPAIKPAQAERLSNLAYQSLIGPIHGALLAAQARGEVAHSNMGMIAGGLLALIESLQAVPESVLATEQQTRHNLACDLIDVMLNGLRTRG